MRGRNLARREKGQGLMVSSVGTISRARKPISPEEQDRLTKEARKKRGFSAVPITQQEQIQKLFDGDYPPTVSETDEGSVRVQFPLRNGRHWSDYQPLVTECIRKLTLGPPSRKVTVSVSILEEADGAVDLAVSIMGICAQNLGFLNKYLHRKAMLLGQDRTVNFTISPVRP